MIRLITLSLLICCPLLKLKGQVGIGTTKPKVILDVRNANAQLEHESGTGIAFPQVTTLPSGGNRGGQIIYSLNDSSYYVYSGVDWRGMLELPNSGLHIGDIKQSFLTEDHDGWVLLDGRDTTALTTSQQVNAELLSLGSVLPDATGKTLKMKSTGVVGDTGGINETILTQTNLPPVVYTGTTSTNGAHTHDYTDKNPILINNGKPGGSGRKTIQTLNKTSTNAGSHTHDFSFSLGNSTPFSIEDSYLSVRTFIYLGR